METNEPNNLDDFEDLEYEGVNSLWKLIAKKMSVEEEFIDVTMAMEAAGGLLIRTKTRNGDAISEALCFVPSAKLSQDENENWIIK
jgi:hypothetical protein